MISPGLIDQYLLLFALGLLLQVLSKLCFFEFEYFLVCQQSTMATSLLLASTTLTHPLPTSLPTRSSLEDIEDPHGAGKIIEEGDWSVLWPASEISF